LHLQHENPKAHTSTLKVIPGFTSFLGSPESTVKVNSASNVQPYNPTPLVLLVNSYWLIVPGRTPNVHLIPSSNANDKKKNPSLAFHSLLHSPSGNLVTSFRVVTHLPSCASTPISGSPSLGKASLHQKIQKLRHIPASNHHTGHTILMAINGNYWVSMFHNGPALGCFTSILLPVPLPFAIATNSCS